jgi:hypothetical protein
VIQRGKLTAIVFFLGCEKKIQNTDITHVALTSISAPARIRSPSVPAAVHTGFEVTIAQTANVCKVTTTILTILAHPDRKRRVISECVDAR